MKYEQSIGEASIRMMDNDSKIGVLATQDQNGYPHLTFISSIQATGPNQLTWGQFSAGESKKFILERPDVGFLALDATYQYLRGLARYTHNETTGPEYELYNKKPLFRYNCYLSFARIYYMDLVGVTPLAKLNMGQIVAGALLSRVKALFQRADKRSALPYTGCKLFSELTSLKFLCYFEAEGRPCIIPIIQACSAGSDRIVYAGMPFGDELSAVPDGAKAAILCLNLNMESVLVKGRAHKGLLDIERVYNSMPPKMGYVYPRSERMETVREF